MNAEQKRMNPADGGSTSSSFVSFIVFRSSRARCTDESSKSANPWKGTCDCSNAT